MPRRRKARVKREFRGNKSARVYTAPFSELEDDDCGRTDEESLDGSTGRLRKGLSVSDSATFPEPSPVGRMAEDGVSGRRARKKARKRRRRSKRRRSSSPEPTKQVEKVRAKQLRLDASITRTKSCRISWTLCLPPLERIR